MNNPNAVPGAAAIPATLDSDGFSRLALFVARHRRNRIVRKIARLCKEFLGWYSNLSYDVRNNGEGYLLETVASFRPKVLFDVGANVGEWTALAKSAAPQAEVHAFEISPPTYATLQKNVGHLAAVHCVSAGLSDAPGSVRIRHFDAMPALTTATEYPHPFAFTETDARVVTGDQYCAEHGVAHIDLLKIDVEGMEERVLKGFTGMLRRKAIDVIQFEYGRVSILHHFLLRDFYLFFDALGYRVGKLYPNYVDFRDYDLEDEDFIGPNYVACSAEKAEYLRALKG